MKKSKLNECIRCFGKGGSEGIIYSCYNCNQFGLCLNDDFCCNECEDYYEKEYLR